MREIRSIQPMSEALRDRLEDILKEKQVLKKQFLLKEGQTCLNFYYIDRGLLRVYYFSDSRDISSFFFYESDPWILIESFLRQVGSKESIVALEDSVLYYITYFDLQQIFKDFPEFNGTFRKLIEISHVKNITRFNAMWMQRAEDRLSWFNKTNPTLSQRVAGKYLASYIGMTEGMLSTLKSATYRSKK